MPHCKEEEETTLHAFWACQRLKEEWRNIDLILYKTD